VAATAALWADGVLLCAGAGEEVGDQAGLGDVLVMGIVTKDMERDMKIKNAD
jgi:hypothetical protein